MKTPYIWFMFQVWYLWLGFAWKMAGKSDNYNVKKNTLNKPIGSMGMIYLLTCPIECGHFSPWSIWEIWGNLSQAHPSHSCAGLVGVKRENGELVLEGEQKLDQCFCTWMSKVFLLPRIRWMGSDISTSTMPHKAFQNGAWDSFGPANVRSSTYVDNMRRASEK